MKNELIHSAHTVGKTNLHLQFIFCEPLARELTIAYLVERAQRLKVRIAAIDCGPDHVHLFIEDLKKYAVKDLARELKAYASRKMRKGYSYLFCNKLWGEKFWSAGYFHRTVGVVTAETVRRYVKESQKKYWEQRQVPSQKTLLNYAA